MRERDRSDLCPISDRSMVHIPSREAWTKVPLTPLIQATLFSDPNRISELERRFYAIGRWLTNMGHSDAKRTVEIGELPSSYTLPNLCPDTDLRRLRSSGRLGGSAFTRQVRTAH